MVDNSTSSFYTCYCLICFPHRGLCDSQSVGKLTTEQFALAMYLIRQKLKGIDPPVQLTPEMIPPSLRATADPGAFGVRVCPASEFLHFGFNCCELGWSPVYLECLSGKVVRLLIFHGSMLWFNPV